MADEMNSNAQTSVSEEKKKTAPKEAKPKEKKPGVFKRLGKFFKECKSELKKIVWASIPSTTKNTILVVVTIVIATAVFYGLDQLFNTAIIDWLGSLYRNIRY